MNDLKISLPSGTAAFEPGAEIEVDVEWSCDRPLDAVQVRLVWSTAGKGDTDIKVAKTVQIRQPDQSGSQRLMIVLPWGPYSFSGKLISILWGLELIVFPSEASTRTEITIAPGGKEVRLQSTAAEDDL